MRLGPRGTWLMLPRLADHAPVTAGGTGPSARHRRLRPGAAPDRTRDGRLCSVAVPGRPAVRDGNGARASARVTPTSAGEQAADRLVAAREAGIDRLVTDWKPDKVPELRRLLGRITTTLVATDASPERDRVAARPPRRIRPFRCWNSPPGYAVIGPRAPPWCRNPASAGIARARRPLAPDGR